MVTAKASDTLHDVGDGGGGSERLGLFDVLESSGERFEQ
jgi:hypothetical protein